MEGGSIVKVFFDEADEVGGGDGGFVFEQFDDDVAFWS